MPRRDHPGNYKTTEKESHKQNRKLAKNRKAGDKGKQVNYEYSRTILNFLKDPISLGVKGGNSNRGRQR